MNDYLELCKPRIALMAVITTLLGYWLGLAPHAGLGDFNRLAWLLLGTALAAASSGALNQVIERDLDALMIRTSRRPLPQGRIELRHALLFGLLLAGAATLILALKISILVSALAAFTIFSYVLVYTPLKTRTPQSTWVGAVSGAMPPVLGWSAARGHLSSEAWALFAIQFLWQIPHFMALFWMYRAQYAAAGFKVMPVVDPKGGVTACQIAIHSFALIPASLMPVFCGIAGISYGWGALGLGIVFLGLGLRASWTMTVLDSRRLFLASLLYLPALFGMMALGRLR